MEPFVLAGVALAGWLVPKSVHPFKAMLRNAKGERDREKAKVHLLHAMESRMAAVEKNQSLMVDRLGGFNERLVEHNETGAKALAHSQELAQILEGHVEQCKEAYRTMGDISARAERTAIQARELFEGNTETFRELSERIDTLQGWRESLQDGVSALADEVTERLNLLSRRIEQMPAEAENVSGMAEALREMATWRAEDAAPRLAAFGEILQLVPAIQEQTAILSESSSQVRSVLMDVADKVEVIESIVGRLPPAEPRIPLGPPPAGRSTDELAELMQQRSLLQQTFLQRAAARGGQPIQPPSRP